MTAVSEISGSGVVIAGDDPYGGSVCCCRSVYISGKIGHLVLKLGVVFL